MKFTKGYIPWNKNLKYDDERKSRLNLSGLDKGRELSKGRKSPWTSERNKIDNRKRTRELHHNWKGGITIINKNIREMPEYKQWRSDCFQRDNWTCRTCRDKGYVTVHHIKSFALIIKEFNIKTTLEALECDELWDLENGITLCEECHKLTDNYKGRGIVTK